MLTSKVDPFNPEFIVVHHSASDRSQSIESIRQYHLSRGWDDIGYHMLVDFNGAIHMGRPLEIPGAHALGFNQQSIGICCVGNFEEEKPTAEMISALTSLLANLCRDFNIPVERIIGHFEVRKFVPAQTGELCPGKYLKQLLPEIRKKVSDSSSASSDKFFPKKCPL